MEWISCCLLKKHNHRRSVKEQHEFGSYLECCTYKCCLTMLFTRSWICWCPFTAICCPSVLFSHWFHITHSEGTWVGCRWRHLVWCWRWWSPTALQPAPPCLWLESPLSSVLSPLDPCLPALFWWFLQNIHIQTYGTHYVHHLHYTSNKPQATALQCFTNIMKETRV